MLADTKSVYDDSRSVNRTNSSLAAQIWRVIAAYVLVFVLPLLALSPLFSARFVSMDDWGTISRNRSFLLPDAHSLGRYWVAPAGSLYTPITYTVWWYLATISRDLHPAPAALYPVLFHGTNVFIHALSALLIAAIIRRILKSNLAAIIGGLLFALHPLQVEAIAWASGTKDLLAAFFSALTILLYALRSTTQTPLSGTPGRGRERGVFVLAISLLAYALALLSKPSAMTVPAILIMIDRVAFHRSWRSTLRSTWPFFMLSIATMIIAWLAQPAIRATPAPLWMRPLMFGDALTFYLWKFIAPIHLAAIYGQTIDVLSHSRWLFIAWSIPAAIAIALFRKRRALWPITLGGAIFILALSPMLGLFRFDFQYYSTVADHYAYFAMLGPAIAIGWIVQQLATNHQRLTLAVTGAALLVLSVLSFRQSRVWHDDESLFTHSLDIAPNGLLALHNLGNLRQAQHRDVEAMALFQRAIEVQPNHFESIGTLATLVTRHGNPEGGAQLFEEFVRQQTLMPPSRRPTRYKNDLFTLAETMLKLGHREKAVQYFQMKLAIDPEDSISIHDLARARELPATAPTPL